MKVKTDHPNYLKDLDNKALLANDIKALHKHRKKISELKHKLDLVLFHLQDIRGTNA